MSLLDVIRGIPERMGRGMERNIGGLLGIDPEDMTEEERRQARRLSQMAVFDAMARGTSPIAGLRQAAELLGTQRAERAQRREAEQRMRAAQQASSQIAGRLMGGAPLPTAPGPAAGDELTGVNVQSQYRQDPMGAMQRAMTPAGLDAMQINPFLQPMIQQAMTPQAAAQYEYKTVDGVGLVAVNKANPRDFVIVQPEKKSAPVAQPTVRTVRLPNGLVQDQWVLPGQSSGTPLGVAYPADGQKPIPGELAQKTILAQGMRDAETELANLNPTVMTEAFATVIPERMKDKDQKQYESAAKRWAANLLYLKTGAQAGEKEIESNWMQYFPLPGDDPETIALKNRARAQERDAVQKSLQLSGVDIDLSLPFPKIEGPDDKNYEKLKSGDLYIDANGVVKRKR